MSTFAVRIRGGNVASIPEPNLTPDPRPLTPNLDPADLSHLPLAHLVCIVTQQFSRSRFPRPSSLTPRPSPLFLDP